MYVKNTLIHLFQLKLVRKSQFLSYRKIVDRLVSLLFVFLYFQHAYDNVVLSKKSNFSCKHDHHIFLDIH